MAIHFLVYIPLNSMHVHHSKWSPEYTIHLEITNYRLVNLKQYTNTDTGSQSDETVHQKSKIPPRFNKTWCQVWFTSLKRKQQIFRQYFICSQVNRLTEYGNMILTLIGIAVKIPAIYEVKRNVYTSGILSSKSCEQHFYIPVGEPLLLVPLK